jgi:hypothetical protein
VQAVTGDPPACKAVDETAHKRGWTANIEVRITRDADFLEHMHPHAPHPVEIDSRPIGWLWRTVTNVAAASGQGPEELAHLRRKWMLGAVAGAVNPPNLSPSLLGGQCVQYSEDWGGADAGADQDHRTLALPQRKAAARGAHVETLLAKPAIRFDLVDKDGPVFAAMPRQISLAVAIDVEPSCHAPALDRRLPDGGVYGFPLPLDVAWPAHIHRKQARHRVRLRSSIEAILSREQFRASGLSYCGDRLRAVWPWVPAFAPLFRGDDDFGSTPEFSHSFHPDRTFADRLLL